LAVTETDVKLTPGGPVVIAWFVGLAATVAVGFSGLGIAVPFLAVALGLVVFGFIVNGPNTARVVQLFGTYTGTLKETGFFWGNPFFLTTKVSLRVRTFETGVTKTEEVKDAAGKVVAAATETRRPLKVNDKDGTPIEIAAVVVWKVTSPTQAVFAVDEYEKYVHTQADAALRGLASKYSYDAPESDTHSLRGHIDEVAAQLAREVQARVHTAGVEIIEARISYLAYAPEIAAAMLQRQQAGAVIAARTLIVDAAVGMVQHALEELSKRNVVDLDPERKAAMVSNLLVVLCGHQNPTPVLNAGTLHN
jgi:regulator of protease activity HflC (stomatin/prohibitin superfamily)